MIEPAGPAPHDASSLADIANAIRRPAVTAGGGAL
jgi:hypothetical protein